MLCRCRATVPAARDADGEMISFTRLTFVRSVVRPIRQGRPLPVPAPQCRPQGFFKQKSQHKRPAHIKMRDLSLDTYLPVA